MSATLNKCFLVGRLARDPELAQTPGGQTVCRMRLAVSEQFVGRQSGERREIVTFLDVTTWGTLAERCGQYLAKGRACLVEGRLYADAWTDKETGKQRQMVKVRADRVGFLGSPAAEGAGAPGESRMANRESSGTAHSPAPTAVEDLPF